MTVIHAPAHTVLAEGEWPDVPRTPLEQRVLDQLVTHGEQTVHDAMTAVGIRSDENQLAMVLRLILRGDLTLVVSGQGQRTYCPSAKRPACPDSTCHRPEHADHPDAHVHHAAWAPDHHDRSER